MNRAAGAPSGFLARMAAASREREAQARARVDEAAMLRAAEARPPPPALLPDPEGFDLVAEVKRRSPAAGALAGADAPAPARQATAYAAGGAAALSVLTEPSAFDGSLEHLESVTAAVTYVPVMRKDFLVSPYQVIEARAAGAGGVLLIAAMLEAAVLRDLLQVARALGLFALVEVFDTEDLDAALPVLADAGPAFERGAARVMLGVNCRDLRTLDVDFQRFAALAPRLPSTWPRVAESGVDTPVRAADVARLGFGFALVGSALMRSADPAAATRALVAAGREAVRCS